jgi:two-component system nitrogen regulation response regulator GlnG
VIRIHIPPLRERREDIPVLMRYFLGLAAKELEVDAKQVSQDVEKMLTHLDWPGNVRQLENLCRWLTVMAPGQEIRVEDLPDELTTLSDHVMTEEGDWQPQLRKWVRQQLVEGREHLLDEATPAFERIMIETALQHTSGRRQEAARLLGWGRNTLTRKLKELGMQETA